MPYPRGWMRTLLRAPLWLYRLGLGELLNEIHIVVLTTRGRKSGLPRHTPVEYRMHGTKVYMISAWGERPQWIKNIIACPQVTLRAGNRVYGANAYVVRDAGEILRALFLFRKRAPAVYDTLIARMTDADSVDARNLPDLAGQLTVVRFDLTDNAALPSLKRDLSWVWFAAGILALSPLLIRSVRRAKQGSS